MNPRNYIPVLATMALAGCATEEGAKSLQIQTAPRYSRVTIDGRKYETRENGVDLSVQAISDWEKPYVETRSVQREIRNPFTGEQSSVSDEDKITVLKGKTQDGYQLEFYYSAEQSKKLQSDKPETYGRATPFQITGIIDGRHYRLDNLDEKGPLERLSTLYPVGLATKVFEDSQLQGRVSDIMKGETVDLKTNVHTKMMSVKLQDGTSVFFFDDDGNGVYERVSVQKFASNTSEPVNRNNLEAFLNGMK